MFTGIVEGTGKVLERAADRLVFEVLPGFELKLGDSVAVNGTCLTAIAIEGRTVTANILQETWKRTNLGDLEAGSLVNLERPARVGSTLDGHIVQGHVDGVGTIRSIEETPLGHKVFVAVPPELSKYLVEKGSVAVDGISLTVIDAQDAAISFEAIPHTWSVTNLQARKAGDRVNLEVDVLAKYVERLLAARIKN